MRTSNWILTAALLVTVSAAAQQATDSQPSAQPQATDAAQTTGTLGFANYRRGSFTGARGHDCASGNRCGSDHDGPGREPVH
jgi:hypothetical protein